MISYSETDVFSVEQRHAFQRARVLVSIITGEPGLRCHELARAVGRKLGLPHIVDGKYGRVEHSWIVLPPRAIFGGPRSGVNSILDTYAVGRLPQVQLIDIESFGPGNGAQYHPGDERTDINEDQIQRLLEMWRSASGA